MKPLIHPRDAFVCGNSVHSDIVNTAVARRDEQIVNWLRARARDCDRRAGFFNNAASYSVAYECAANAIELGEVRS